MQESAQCLDRPVRISPPRNGPYAGRRLRALARLVSASNDGSSLCFSCLPLREGVTRMFRWEGGAVPSYRAVLAWLDALEAKHPARAALSTMYMFRDSYPSPSCGNAYLTDGLQDLGDQIVTDIHEACQAFDDPNLWYPGVDEGIEPVTDEHVARVIEGLQRELRRELRNPQGSRNTQDAFPAAPLADLPWHVQRALVERRRLRYKQWGLERKQWEENRFSLWDIPEDPDWVPSHIYTDY
jgi:hypothetical protein